MAAEFRNAVVAAGHANPILTGHSLGGGLAGFVASLYGDEAKIFDNMPFQLSAEQVFTYALLDDAYYAANPSAEDQAKSHYARDIFFGGQMPSAMLPDYQHISAQATPGEFLETLRGGQTVPAAGRRSL